MKALSKKWMVVTIGIVAFAAGLFVLSQLVKPDTTMIAPSLYPAMTNQELADRAAVVSRCKVLEEKPAHMTTSIDGSDTIVTDYIVEMLGAPQEEERTFVLRTKGGEWANERTVSEDSAAGKLVAGQEYFMFLTKEYPDDSEGEYYRLSYLDAHSIYAMPSDISINTISSADEWNSVGQREGIGYQELQTYVKYE